MSRSKGSRRKEVIFCILSLVFVSHRFRGCLRLSARSWGVARGSNNTRSSHDSRGSSSNALFNGISIARSCSPNVRTVIRIHLVQRSTPYLRQKFRRLRRDQRQTHFRQDHRSIRPIGRTCSTWPAHVRCAFRSASTAAPDSERYASDIHHFYCESAWKKLRLSHLAGSSLCISCLAGGVGRDATQVHHVIDVRQCWDLRLDPPNLDGRWALRHSRLTASEMQCPSGRRRLPRMN